MQHLRKKLHTQLPLRLTNSVKYRMQDLGSNLEQLRRELIGKLLKLSPKRRVKILTRLLQRNLNVHIAFEDIYDPHNIMAATRTIDAFGFQHVHIIFNKLAPFDPRKTGKKTSASANKWLSFHVYASEVLEKPTGSESGEKLYARSLVSHNLHRSRHPIKTLTNNLNQSLRLPVYKNSCILHAKTSLP